MTRKEQIKAELRRRIEARLVKKQDKRKHPSTPPRYDEVFFKGLEWLNGC